MPRRTVFDADAVVDAALAVLRRSGVGAVTARAVARELGASIAPVYSALGSMEALEQALTARMRTELLAYTRRPYTSHPFLNMGMGIVVFAREEPQCYRALFLDGPHIKQNLEAVRAQLVEDMGRIPHLAHLPRSVRLDLYTKLSVYTHGLATMVCLRVTDDVSDDFIRDALGEVGAVVVGAALGTPPARPATGAAAVAPAPDPRRKLP